MQIESLQGMERYSELVDTIYLFSGQINQLKKHKILMILPRRSKIAL